MSQNETLESYRLSGVSFVNYGFFGICIHITATLLTVEQRFYAKKVERMGINCYVIKAQKHSRLICRIKVYPIYRKAGFHNGL